uniref:Otopetrin n=1 Tax=Anopheles quadriannulatus TaxID=34691 RepID=A0A2Y9D3H4_ANOQN
MASSPPASFRTVRTETGHSRSLSELDVGARRNVEKCVNRRPQNQGPPPLSSGSVAASVMLVPELRVHPPPDEREPAAARGSARDNSAASSARPSPHQSRRGTLDSVELVERYHFAKNPNRSGSHSPSLYESRRRLSSFGAQKRAFLELIRKQGSRLSLARKFSEVSNKTDELSREHRKQQRDSILARNQLGLALSALYAKLLIVMGITLPLTELVAREAPPNFHQPFYLYLYGVSILFCSFLFVARWRRAAQLEFLSQCPAGADRPGSGGPARPAPTPHSGSFYLRIGAIAFGIGSLVYSALDFGQYFELDGSKEPCRSTHIMSTLVHNAAPFLFPCTIEYSLICALTLYELWRALNRTLTATAAGPRKPSTSAPDRRTVTGRPANRLSIDCSSAQRGLFAGIVTLVLTLIVLIMYFVLRRERQLRHAATLEIVAYEIALYSVTLGAVVAAMLRMRDLRVLAPRGSQRTMPLDCHLLLVTQTGIYIYGVFSIIGTYHTHGQLLHWAVLSEVLALAQTSLQTLFVLSSWWRRCKGARQNRAKPGRELVTFLLVANLAAWLVNSLVKSNASFRPLVMGFYGAGAWAIIAHISMPLAIFYRFHSTICLFEIWKNSYKARYTEG